MKKIYTITDPDPVKLDKEITASNSLVNYHCLTTTGDVVEVHFDSFLDESALSLVMANHINTPTPTYEIEEDV